jgi:hypothetical protein
MGTFMTFEEFQSWIRKERINHRRDQTSFANIWRQLELAAKLGVVSVEYYRQRIAGKPLYDRGFALQAKLIDLIELKELGLATEADLSLADQIQAELLNLRPKIDAYEAANGLVPARRKKGLP